VASQKESSEGSAEGSEKVTRRRALGLLAAGGLGVAGAGLLGSYYGGVFKSLITGPGGTASNPGSVLFPPVPPPGGGTQVPPPPGGGGGPPPGITADMITGPLEVAQWYAYWPPNFPSQFSSYINTTFAKTVKVNWTVYSSNEELFNLMTIAGQVFDAIFPSNYMVDQMRNAGLLQPFNRDWIPNLSNMFPQHLNQPFDHDAQNRLFSVPYQWGSTGIGFRTDVFDRADLDVPDGLGWDTFWTPSYTGSQGTFDLTNKLMMMNDAREVFSAALKRMGWLAQGASPTATVPPQWTLNSTDDTQILAAKDALIDGANPLLLTYDTVNQGPYLANKTTYADHAWTGDVILFAIQPWKRQPNPVDYIVPKQGGAVWMDNMCIPANARNVATAHVFANYIMDGVIGALITDYNLYATPNAAAYDLLTTYPNANFGAGYDPREDTRIYPDTTTLARMEWSLDVGIVYAQKYIDYFEEVKAAKG